jgi:arylsulfatase A-like enzyme
VRSKQHVYTRYLDPKPDFEQLFDLEKDPEELHNLTGSPEFAGLLKQLRARTDELYQQTGPASQGERKKPSYPRSVK